MSVVWISLPLLIEKMKTKQIDPLQRAHAGLRGWMTRDFDAQLGI